MTGTTVMTRPPAHFHAFFFFAPAAVHVFAVVVALVGVPVPVVSSTALGMEAVVVPTVVTRRTTLSTAAAAERATAPAGRASVHYRSLLSVALAAAVVTGFMAGVHSSAARRAAGVVGPTVVTRRTMLSTAAASGRATAGRAPVHYCPILSIALAGVEVAGLMAGVHSSAWRGAAGVVGSAAVTRYVRFVVEGLQAVLVLVTVAASSVGRLADRSVGSVGPVCRA